MNIFGFFVGCVDEHRTFKAGIEIWQGLNTCIAEGNISPNFLKDVEQHKEKLSLISTALCVKDSNSESRRQKCLADQISELVKTEKDLSDKFTLLKSVINYENKVSEDSPLVDGMREVIREFNKRKDHFRTMKLSELNDKFWGPLLPLLDSAYLLQPLMNSVSFTNNSMNDCLQEDREFDSATTDGEEPVPNDVYSSIKLLTRKRIERFEARWNSVFNNPGSLDLKTMKTLLESIKSEEELEEEFSILEQYFQPKRLTTEVKLYMKDYVTYPDVLKRVNEVISVLETFGLIDPTNATVSTLTTFAEKFKDREATDLKTLRKAMASVLKIFLQKDVLKETHGVIEELSRSSELHAFVKKTVDQDIRFLIDAVEEHSDQFVSEALVSDLIDVHHFLAPLTRLREPELFLMKLVNLCKDHQDIAIKIQQCSTNVNSLRGLYTSVANRGEITKEIIANCSKKGVYTVSLENGGICEAKMSYEKNEKSTAASPANYSLSDLHDLRSRAHLIASSDKKPQKLAFGDGKQNDQDINFADFIEQVNLLTEIKSLLLKLRSSGYVKYRKGHWQNMKSTKDLQDMKDILQKGLEEWRKTLSDACQKYYFMNYYRSDQLCILHDFLTNRSQVKFEEVLSLINFVDPNIKKEHLEAYQEMHPLNVQSESIDNPNEMVSIIGNALEEIFAKTSPTIRPIVNDQERPDSQLSVFDSGETVKSGELFVASLEEESLLTANVMLTLYENTSNAFPEPYQVVFCDPQTTWEEIQLVLQRCFAQSKLFKPDSLFCIANVELLPNEVQFKLVNLIKEKQNSVDEPWSMEGNTDYRLALICRGGDHHHMVEEFAQYCHRIAGMSDLALSRCLESGWPGVKTITSTLPGLGKTERIKREMHEKKMDVVTFSISGPLDQTKLIQRLKELNIKYYHGLHLDIGEFNDPIWLDIFLFQLVVTGMVSSGTQFYHLQTRHVYIEIANTLNDRLGESLVISKCFTCVHLQWRNYEDLLVSSRITSKLQVVCQYLDIHARAKLESTDVHFTGPQKVESLPTKRCRELLAKYYSSDADTTFTALNTFLGVLSKQLLKFSKSAFFKIANLKSMLGDGARGVRTNLFLALLDVSKEFESHSMSTCCSSNLQTLSQKESAQALDKVVTFSGISSEHMVERVKGMIQWEESNHLLVTFHGTNSQAIEAVYRDKNLVPQNVKNLLNSQVVRGKTKKLEDFTLMDQDQLKDMLVRIACTKPPSDSQDSLSSYALTPDNILKMILIILRVRANVPVIIMGETGCGKTSLVRYLANICQIQFYTFSCHAGITEEEVKELIKEKGSQARKSREQIWIFLDEINTCDHLGLICDVMCHHTLFGRPLPKNLVFLAACNPYELRPEENIQTAGLEGKNVTDEYSRLVYRVHPLPEAMIAYVWDYGSLAPKDEEVYIQRMVGLLPRKFQGALVELLARSQKFIRDAENNHFCVSLRDVHRCILLVQWFIDMIKKRKQLKLNKKHEYPKNLQDHNSISERYDKMPIVKSIVLALAHCYLSRLPTADLRQSYRQCMMKLFSGTGTIMTSKEGVDSFSAIVRMEEEDYLNRMELPSGTARNAALRENVFVMLVSILNRIPVFVVGKPGCSKSLSMQLIRSNLRGRDSRHRLFRELPQLYVVSYQGSESSTSEGIIKVFEKARKYVSHNKDGNVLAVVLLDEVGLAENSKCNPLKVLHSLLEPENGKSPDVAVVGISNWALDAAKMNRAIHLSRPEPTVRDLYDTGNAILHADSKTTGNIDLYCLAEAYHEYQSKQSHPNFHGLRDYYSLIKSLSLSGSSDLQQINMALQRNFGGIPGELTNIQKVFLDKLKQSMPSSGEDTIIPATKLIQKNLADTRARHLMLITSGDSAIGILKQSLTHLKREIITIFGSRFEEDLSEDYNYRILSRIILCMELDCILILRDLERIYGSLYDMLNQNYAVVGKRKNCRVALGAYSNPMCHVNDDFRCIVLTDHQKLDFSDPPFLNRFEKQLLRFSDVLNEKQQEIITRLDSWVQQISTVQGLESQFKESDMFIGFHEDTLPSLVLLHSQDTDESNEEIIQKCKDDLMWVATPDGVLRAQKSDRLKEDSQEVDRLSDEYFEKPIHDGLASFIETVILDHETAFLSGDEIGSKTIVMTYSTVHTDIPKCLGDTFTCQTERLGAYKSEKQLQERVDHFWSVSEKDLLVLQCKPELDGVHMLLARSIIEDKRSCYEVACQQSGNEKQKKHVCIVVHVQRGTTPNAVPWQFSFLCGWKQVFLDVLEDPLVPLNEIRTESIQTLLTSSTWSLRTIAQNDLMWCFTCIKYTQHQRPLKSILHIAKNLFESETVYQAIQLLVLKWVNTANGFEETGADEPWQVKVACDRQALINSSTLSSAMEQHVSRLVCQPLAKIIYFLEKENAWPPHVFDVPEDEDSEPENEDLWCNLITQEAFFNMSEIPDPLGAESYILDSASLDLHLPFSQVVIRRVDAMKNLVLEDYTQVKENKTNLDKNSRLKPNVQLQQIQRYSKIIANGVPEIREFPVFCCNSYMADLFDMISADFRETMSRHQRVSLAKSAFVSYVKQTVQVDNLLHFYIQLHLFVWISKEQILNQLRLVDICRHFIRSQVLEHLTDEVLSSQDTLLFVEETHDDFLYSDSEDETNAFCKQDKSKVSQESQPEVDANETNNKTISDELEEESEFTHEWNEDEADERNETEEEEHGEEQECFEDVLVTLFCEEMLPSQETVEEQNGGIESWIRNASLLLSLASKISHQTPALHFLRLCVDFANMTLVPSTLAEQSSYPLYILNEIGDKLKPRYLDTDESFDNINDHLIKPLEDQVKGQEEKHRALQKFSALFYGRCIDTNVDTFGARSIVEQVLSLDRADVVLMMSPVILRLLRIEEMESPGIFVHIITNQSLIEKCSCLQNIDEVFKDLFTKDLIHHDSYAAVMVCDLIQSLLKLDDRYSIQDIDRSDCELLRFVRGATKMLSGNEQENRGLVLLASVAFLRAFFAMLSSFIAEKPNVLTADSSFSHVMSEINSLILTGDATCRKLSLKMFFLKQLHQTDMNLFDLRKLCQESKMLPAINSVFTENRKVPKAEFVFARELPEYQQVKAAYWTLLTKEDDKEMLTILRQCQNSPNHRLALMGILGNMIYLKQAVRKLSDKEECLAKWFSKKSEQFPFPMKEVLLRIIGRKEFDHHQMQLSPESSVDEVEMISLILHISCVLASGVQGENSPLKQYFLDPLKCKQTYILAHGEARTHRVFEKRESTKGPSPFTCHCGLRIMFKDDEADNWCPYCSTKRVDLNPENSDTKTSQNVSSPSKGYSPLLPETVPSKPPKQPPHEKPPQWDDCTNDMSPSVFRALHLIVHTCLYAGIAMGISSKKDLLSLLNSEEVQNSDIGKGCQDPVEFCFDHIKADLKFLTTILCCKKQIAIKVMHLVIEKCTELIRGKSLNNNTCSTLEQRLEWEVEFSNIVKDVLPKALGSAKALKEVMRMKPEENKASTKVEDQILELDAYPAEPAQQNQQLKRLFRVTRQPSLKEFHSTFVNASKDLQEKHSFLLLFFAEFYELPKIRYLSHLLKWARLVSSALTHRISRKDAQSYSIDDFINGHLLKQEDNKSEDDVKSQKKLFNSFKEAWNNMGDFVNQELTQEGDEMPHLTEMDPISYCLTESDSGIYLVTAIRILVSFQNSILDEMIFFSSQRQHPALSFLEKNNNCSGISSVSLQEANEKEIITFRWSDELFKYAQNNPDYGQGEEVSYDFERIEIELANDIAFGKCHLTGSLNKFIFSKELFHTSGPMLTEIRESFHQSPKLPDNVRQALTSLKERRIQDAQNLLQHIEVLIFLLKLKLKSVAIDVEMTLEKFVDMWKTMLPNPFPVSLLPEPRGSIKVKHIAAFYEALEDLLADGAIEGLPKKLRKDLMDETRNRLDCLIDNKDGVIKLQTFLNALRRFVFRYLSSEKFLPELNTPLSSCLKESSLWSPAESPDPQVIPKEMTLEYIHSIISHLQELDKVIYLGYFLATRIYRFCCAKRL